MRPPLRSSLSNTVIAGLASSLLFGVLVVLPIALIAHISESGIELFWMLVIYIGPLLLGFSVGNYYLCRYFGLLSRWLTPLLTEAVLLIAAPFGYHRLSLLKPNLAAAIGLTFLISTSTIVVTSALKNARRRSLTIIASTLIVASKCGANHRLRHLVW